MKIREDFVTNSSSSLFIIQLKGKYEELDENWRSSEIIQKILHPEKYMDEFLAWQDEHYPIEFVDNPNNIEPFIEAEGKWTEEERKKFFKDNDIPECCAAFYSKPLKRNPEYDKLKIIKRKHTAENEYVEDKYGWSITSLDEPDYPHNDIVGLKFSTTMDNFDYARYCEFLGFKIYDLDNGYNDRGYDDDRIPFPEKYYEATYVTDFMARLWNDELSDEAAEEIVGEDVDIEKAKEIIRRVWEKYRPTF